MFNHKMLAVLIGACAFFLVSGPALAQKGVPGPGAGAPGGTWAPNVPPGSLVDPPAGAAITRDNMSGSRLNRQREEERRMAERRRRAERGEALAPINADPARVRRLAGEVATAAGLDCQMTDVAHPGVTPEEAPIYEAACAGGPGYVLIASTPPRSYNCFELAGAVAAARLDNPAAEGMQCELPANQNGPAVIGGWAREAGVTCQVDQAVAVGRSVDDNLIYEVGCGGRQGYWLERTAAGWSLQDCATIAEAGERCLFTRPSRN